LSGPTTGKSRQIADAQPRRLGASDFGRQIEKAELAGVERSAMTLRLTLGDVAALKRDRSLALEEISFANGEMRFRGVKVIAGGLAASELQFEASPPA
jgi:hypothetical protein